MQANQEINFAGGHAAFRRQAVAVFFIFAAWVSCGQEPTHPLKPHDLSSPRAALKTFIELGDALGAFLAEDYMPSPSRAEFKRLVLMGDELTRSLDLSHVPPALRLKEGRAVALSLYETLNRIRLPPLAEIPGKEPRGEAASTNLSYWVIPDTEIVLVRTASGVQGGEYKFSSETVAHANRFCDRVRELPYARSVPLQGINDIVVCGGGWLIPYRWVQSMPPWFRLPLAGQAVWKWLAFVMILSALGAFLCAAFRLSRHGSSEHPFLRALAHLTFPAGFFVAAPVVAYLSLVQLNMRGGVGNAIELAVTAVVYLAGAWLAWRAAPVAAEAIIASPQIAPESIDAHLIRICTRLLGIIVGAMLLAKGADQLGVPVYGIIAGLGVGGLAIALAAQPTIENLIGGLSLFADKPVRVGEYCRCGTDEGTVEAIGLRSTRIRGEDRTLTTIPNATLSKMSIENLAERDRMLIQSVIGVRYETSSEQLRYLLVRIRELLLGHPRVQSDTVRVRFVGFGASSLDIEVFAYVMTRNKAEFLAVREDLWLRVMDIVEQSGTGLAFPSQTLYLAKDQGLDTGKTEAAKAQTRQWQEESAQKSADSSKEMA